MSRLRELVTKHATCSAIECYTVEADLKDLLFELAPQIADLMDAVEGAIETTSLDPMLIATENILATFDALEKKLGGRDAF